MGWRLMQFLNNINLIIQFCKDTLIENVYSLTEPNLQIFITVHRLYLVNIVKHKEKSGNPIVPKSSDQQICKVAQDVQRRYRKVQERKA